MNFPKNLSIITTTLALMLCGCSTAATKIVSGTVRPGISPEQVKVYFVPPAKFEVVGIITSGVTGFGHGQGGAERSLNRAKKEAAMLGANGLLFGATTSNQNDINSSTTSTGTGGLYGPLRATIIYVTQENP